MKIYRIGKWNKTGEWNSTGKWNRGGKWGRGKGRRGRGKGRKGRGKGRRGRGKKGKKGEGEVAEENEEEYVLEGILNNNKSCSGILTNNVFKTKKEESGLELATGLVVDIGTKMENGDTDTEDVAQEMVLKLTPMNQKTAEQPVVTKAEKKAKKKKKPK